MAKVLRSAFGWMQPHLHRVTKAIKVEKEEGGGILPFILLMIFRSLLSISQRFILSCRPITKRSSSTRKNSAKAFTISEPSLFKAKHETF